MNIIGRGGYYDDDGRWKRTRFCFVSCGDRCNCTPPFGVYQLPAEKVAQRKREKEAFQHALRQGLPTNPEEMP